jgi:arginyl-tRNA synthetase
VLFTKNERAIRSIWVSQLRSALDACLNFPDISRIPITGSRDPLQVAYRSAIALKIAPKLTKSPLEIAREIVAQLPETADFAVSVSPSGWIDCQLTHWGWAQWLQHWTGKAMDPPSNTRVPPPVDGFPVQYAHARCCTLLRLADREGLLVLQSSPTDVEIIAPDPLPWLDETQFPRLQHPMERALMCQLAAVVDALEDSDRHNYSQLAMKLSAAFEEFHSHCRIFGEVKMANPALAIGRSGLVGVTQKVLKCLLETKFGIPSPIEL